MSTFDHKKNKLSHPNNQEEIAKESLPTNGTANRMSNAFASLKSQQNQQNNQEETAKEFYSENDQASRMSNAFTSLECLTRLHQ